MRGTVLLNTLCCARGGSFSLSSQLVRDPPPRRLIRRRPHNCSAGSQAWPLPTLAPSFPTCRRSFRGHAEARGGGGTCNNNNNNNKMSTYNCFSPVHTVPWAPLEQQHLVRLQEPHRRTRTRALWRPWIDAHDRGLVRNTYTGASTYPSPPWTSTRPIPLFPGQFLDLICLLFPPRSNSAESESRKKKS